MAEANSQGWFLSAEEMAMLVLTTVILLHTLPVSCRVWRQFESSCYTALSPDDCVGVAACAQLCVSLNASLAEIETPEELAFLSVYGEDEQFWVGVEYNGTDSHDGVHRWVNSRLPVDPGFFKPGD